MDWINMIQSGAAMDADDPNRISMTSYTWNFSGTISPKFPNMAPYITGITINPLSTTIGFDSKERVLNLGDPGYYSPSRRFYFPKSATLYSVGGSISGNPVKLGGQNTGQTRAGAPDSQESDLIASNAIFGDLRSPWESEKDETEEKKDQADTLAPPVLNQRFDIRKGGTTQFNLTYTLAPSSASEMQFDSLKWNDYTDVNWGDLESILITASGTASTALNVNHSDGLYSGSFTFSGNGAWREYTYLNEDAERFATNPDPDAALTEARRQQYSQTHFNTTYALSTSFSPFYLSNTWKNSKFTYTLSGLAVKSEFTGTGDDPTWDMVYGEWNKEKITAHSMSAVLSASVMDKTQSLTFSADLPPRDPSYSASAAFNIWVTNTTASWRIRYSEEEGKWKFEPFTLNETIRFGDVGTLTYSMSMNTKENLNLNDPAYSNNNQYEFTSITTNLGLTKWGLSAGYTASRMAGYELDEKTGWIVSGDDPSLKSNTAFLSFNKTFTKNNLWKNMFDFSIGINTRLNFDLQRYTNSSFSFGLTLGLGIKDFLRVSLTFNSLNSVIYRYYRSLLPNLPDSIRNATGDQYNLFLDLFNSFRFDDDNLRRSSGFKMQNMTLSLTHYMGDWNATLNLAMAPYLPTGSRQYQMNTDFSFLVQWIPISEIKSDMSYNKKDDKWTIK
jgi:hypothetical protein